MSTQKKSLINLFRKEDFSDLPPFEPSQPRQTTLSVSLLIPAREATHALKNTLQKTHEFLTQTYQKDFEIILIPNPHVGAQFDESMRLSHELANQFSQVVVVPHLSPPQKPGKGAALRTGYLASRGRKVLFTDSDLPYDLEFFSDADRLLEQGFDLITANRRVPDSRFDLPTELLSVAYHRHRLGLLFNRCVRIFFPIGSSDTQAGIKAMSRRLADRAFKLQRCPGFFFDLELFLTARAMNCRHAEVPVTLSLNSEKTTVRVFRESILAIFWLVRIWIGYLSGYYGHPEKQLSVLSNYQGLSAGSRLFLQLRYRLTPYQKMAGQLPQRGTIYDLGCGHGLFGLHLAQSSPDLQVIGLDHDLERVKIARRASNQVPNLTFESGDISRIRELNSPDAISIIDVLHYFDLSTQESHLKEAWRLLPQGGVLIFREVDPKGGFIAKWNRFYEILATTLGFTQSSEKDLYFRPQEDWLELLQKIGFRARAMRCSHFLFADVLFVGVKQTERTS